jgi:hypothetical protein
MRERWFGATGRKVPQIAVEGELDVDGALVLDDLDEEAVPAAFDEGKPIVVRAASAEAVPRRSNGLRLPVLVPAERRAPTST